MLGKYWNIWPCAWQQGRLTIHRRNGALARGIGNILLSKPFEMMKQYCTFYVDYDPSFLKCNRPSLSLSNHVLLFVRPTVSDERSTA